LRSKQTRWALLMRMKHGRGFGCAQLVSFILGGGVKQLTRCSCSHPLPFLNMFKQPLIGSLQPAY